MCRSGETVPNTTLPTNTGTHSSVGFRQGVLTTNTHAEQNIRINFLVCLFLCLFACLISHCWIGSADFTCTVFSSLPCQILGMCRHAHTKSSTDVAFSLKQDDHTASTWMFCTRFQNLKNTNSCDWDTSNESVRVENKVQNYDHAVNRLAKKTFIFTTEYMNQHSISKDC